MKGRKKLWKSRKKNDDKTKLPVHVHFVKGICSLMANTIVNQCGVNFQNSKTAQELKQMVDITVKKLMPANMSNGDDDSDNESVSSQTSSRLSSRASTANNGEDGDSSSKKGSRSKRKKMKHKKEKNPSSKKNDDQYFETKESEILYTSVFSQEVQDQRDRIRPNSAYDDGTNSKKTRSHRQKKKSPDVVSDATDLIESDKNNNSKKSKEWKPETEKKNERGVVVRPPVFKGDHESKLPSHFTGVFVPMDARVPMRVVYFKLESWQTQISNILIEGEGTAGQNKDST